MGFSIPRPIKNESKLRKKIRILIKKQTIHIFLKRGSCYSIKTNTNEIDYNNNIYKYFELNYYNSELCALDSL